VTSPRQKRFAIPPRRGIGLDYAYTAAFCFSLTRIAIVAARSCAAAAYESNGAVLMFDRDSPIAIERACGQVV
jgi:hypothetical protein